MLDIRVVYMELSNLLRPYNIKVNIHDMSMSVDYTGLRKVFCGVDDLKVRWLNKEMSVYDPTFNVENMVNIIVNDTVRMEEMLSGLGNILSFNNVSMNGTSIRIECYENTKLEFHVLKKLGEFFGTEEIDINSEIRSGGYCETCHYEFNVEIITAFNPTKNIDVRNI